VLAVGRRLPPLDRLCHHTAVRHAGRAIAERFFNSRHRAIVSISAPGSGLVSLRVKLRFPPHPENTISLSSS
jgi:hypothetical protein